jgi:FtsP/CotA-like multicopper oxidase with cupredoxin domain
MSSSQLTRRKVLGGIGLVGLAGGGLLARQALAADNTEAERMARKRLAAQNHAPGQQGGGGAHGGHANAGMVGEVDHVANGFNPDDILTDFDYGTPSTLPDGRTLREHHIFAANKEIEVAPGIKFPAWTYNGRIPGPTIRCTEGDRIKINFTNGSDHAHSMHFHGIHTAEMDGIVPVKPGETFVYEFDAEPFGLHLYHCHVLPLAAHIAKGLYGTFIIDPKDGYKNKADHEMVMVMSGFDVDFDGANEIYNVNAIPFHYDKHPIKIKQGALVRVFLVNILEYDMINSFHLHATFFDYYPTGTRREPNELTDTVLLGQGQRGILEFRYKYPGKYLFHAHKTEFAELGWVGQFDVEAA